MKTRFMMRHRTTIERNTPASDGGGGYTESWSTIASSQPCHAWYISTDEPVTSDRPGTIDTRAILMPLGTDIHEGDRLLSVTNRTGTKTIFDGPLSVDAVGERPDHLRLTTRKIA